MCLCAAASVRAHLICLRLHFWGLPEAAHGGLHVGSQLSLAPQSCLQKLPMQPVRNLKLRALARYLLAHLHKHTEILLYLLMRIALSRMSDCKRHDCTQLAAVSAMELLQGNGLWWSLHVLRAASDSQLLSAQCEDSHLLEQGLCISTLMLQLLFACCVLAGNMGE